MRYVYGHEDQRTNDIVLRFVAQLIPHVDRGFPAGTTSIGVRDDEGRLVAGIVLYHWNRKSGTIEVAMAAQPGVKWLTRETVRRLFDFVFVQRACQMLIMRVRSEDERTLGQLARFGFAFLKVPRLYGRDDDGVMCLLTAEAYAEHPAMQRRENVREAA